MTFPEVVASLRASRRHLLTNLRLNHAAATGIPTSTSRPKPAVPPLPGIRMPPSTQHANSNKRSPTRQATDSHHSTDTRQQASSNDNHAATPSHHPAALPASYPTVTFLTANQLPPGYHVAAPGAPPAAPFHTYYTVFTASTPNGPAPTQGDHPVIVPYAAAPYATSSRLMDGPPGQHPYAAAPGAPPGAAHYVIHTPGEGPSAPTSSYPTTMRIHHHHHHTVSSAASHHPAAPNTHPRESATSSSSGAHNPSHPSASPTRPSSATSNDNSPPHLNSASNYSASDSLLFHAARIRAKRLQDLNPPHPTSFKPTPTPSDPTTSLYPGPRPDTSTAATATRPHLAAHTNPLQRTSPTPTTSRSPHTTPHEAQASSGAPPPHHPRNPFGATSSHRAFGTPSGGLPHTVDDDLARLLDDLGDLATAAVVDTPQLSGPPHTDHLQDQLHPPHTDHLQDQLHPPRAASPTAPVLRRFLGPPVQPLHASASPSPPPAMAGGGGGAWGGVRSGVEGGSSLTPQKRPRLPSPEVDLHNSDDERPPTPPLPPQAAAAVVGQQQQASTREHVQRMLQAGGKGHQVLLCCVPTCSNWELVCFLEARFAVECPAAKILSKDHPAIDDGQVAVPVVVVVVQEPFRAAAAEPKSCTEGIATDLLPDLPLLRAMGSRARGKQLVVPALVAKEETGRVVGSLIWEEGSPEWEQWQTEVTAQDKARQNMVRDYGPWLVEHVVDLSKKWLLAEQKLPLRRDMVLPDYITPGLRGRAKELSELARQKAAKSVVMLQLLGPAGVGKTTLVKACFNELHAQDRTVRCCFLRLPAPDPGGKVDAGVITWGQKVLLEALACKQDVKVLSPEAGRSQLVQELTGFKVLIVVDNAWGGAEGQQGQLEQLLPGSLLQLLAPGSVVLVTSRDSEVCAGFRTKAASGSSRHGEGAGKEKGHVIVTRHVEFLLEAEARQLLCFHAHGHDAAAGIADTDSTNQLLRECGGLPLAVEVVGRHLASRPNAEELLSSMTEVLTFVFGSERAGRLDAQQTVFGALEVSWQLLTSEEKQTLLDMDQFMKTQPLVLVRCCVEESDLVRLQRLALVSVECEAGVDRVELHKVVSAYCRELVGQEEPRQRLQLSWDDDAQDEEVAEELAELVAPGVRGLALALPRWTPLVSSQMESAGLCPQLLQLAVHAPVSCDLTVQLDQLRYLHLQSDRSSSLPVSGRGAASVLSLEGMPHLSLAILEQVDSVRELHIAQCKNLRGLSISGCLDMQLLRVSGTTNLLELHVSGCPRLEESALQDSLPSLIAPGSQLRVSWQS